MKRTYPQWETVLPICREALRRGHLTMSTQGWRFGRRQFAFKTVAVLIAAGEAVRVGNIVRAA